MKRVAGPVAEQISTLPASHAIIEIGLASIMDRSTIYRLRHEVYARELGQHQVQTNGELRDEIDAWNVYIVARVEGEIAGFISITPPGNSSYSVEKYFPRETLPFPVDDGLFEIRLLTVLRKHRGRELASLLMYAALRYVESHGGSRIVAIGRQQVVEMYTRSGLKPLGRSVKSGAVTFELMETTTTDLRGHLKTFAGLLERLRGRTRWRFPFTFNKPAACFHGGAFFEFVGEQFDDLARSRQVINADVLDAWFPPAPRVLAALEEHLPWLLRTSPPASCRGLVKTIAQVRGVRPCHIVPGAGSSDLIFRALRQWVGPSSHALLLDPTYGEYAHVLEQVIGCTVDRLSLSRENHYQVPLERLEVALRDDYDMVILVNPNSPTGAFINRRELEAALQRAPVNTRFWIDETYVEYAGPNQSLESFASRSDNVVVCKSLSKVYALSGARAAYLCGAAPLMEELRAITPPWVVSLPAQVAAVNALQSPEYYQTRYRETAALREDMAQQLTQAGLDVVPGIANFILCQLPATAPSAAAIVQRCREDRVFLRDAGLMGSRLGSRALRIAVKDEAANQEILRSLLAAMEQ